MNTTELRQKIEAIRKLEAEGDISTHEAIDRIVLLFEEQ